MGAWVRVASGYSLRLGRSPQASSARPPVRASARASVRVRRRVARPTIRPSAAGKSRRGLAERPACVRSYTIRPVFGEVQSGTHVGPVLIFTFVCSVRGVESPKSESV